MGHLESDVEQAAVKWAVARGWMSIKMTPAGQTGWPDRLFVSRCGIHVWIEFKRPGDRSTKPRKLQAYRIRKLRERAVNAHWTDALGDAQELLKFYED